jgi:hypothetical protein
MPVLPFLSDDAEHLRTTLEAAKAAGAAFVVFGGMTLKSGRQAEHFYAVLARWRADLVAGYQSIYTANRWGTARKEYYAEIERRFSNAARALGLPRRIPPALYADLLDAKQRAVVMLEHLEYVCRLDGRPAPYGRAARALAACKEPLSVLLGRLESLPGVGKVTARLIQEMAETGRCRYLRERL